MDINQTPKGSDITGIGLEIDVNTQNLCEAYNKSSGVSRSVLYVLLAVSVVSIIAVFNSNWRFNWADERVHQQDTTIDRWRSDSLKNIAKLGRVLYNDSLARINEQEKQLKATDVSNFYDIKASIAGVTIDVNDLVSVFGMTLILLLVVLKFLLIREKSNLQIAFNSISERYTARADYNKQVAIWKAQLPEKEKEDTENWDDLISDINFVRRRYHYNFLSMNEVFNMPALDGCDFERKRSWFSDFVNRNLFYFFLFIYSYTIFNDFCSVSAGWNINPSHTVVIEFIGFVSYIIVFNICRSCVDIKLEVINLFENFRTSEYRYKESHHHPTITWGNLILRNFVTPVAFFLGIVIAARLMLRVPYLGNPQLLFDIKAFKI